MKKNKKKKRIKLSKRHIAIVILSICLIICLVLQFSRKDNSTEIQVVDNMEEYGYELKASASEYYKKTFSELKDVLNATELNEEEYARAVSKLFVSDFYTLSNKMTKSDVGGVQFVYKPYREDFIKYAKESVYDIVKSNIDGNRNQELPSVKEIEITKLSIDSFKYQDKTDEKAYIISMKIAYEKDLGYAEEVTLTLIHVDNKLEVASME